MSPKSRGSKTGLEPIAKRVPIERKIDLQFANFEGLITRMSANLSTSGMFVQSDSPESPGTEFDFGIRIEEWSPVQGTARVVWTRPETESPERPAGMGVEFIKLDAQSRRMIRWLVDKHEQEGGKPFDVQRVPAGASKYSPGPSQTGSTLAASTRGNSPGDQRSEVDYRSRPSKGMWVALGLIGLLLAGYGGYRYWLDYQSERSARGPLPAGSTQVTRESQGGAELEAQPADAASGSQAISPASTEAVAAFVRTWSDAWESGQADQVKSLYADDFAADAYGGRAAWEAGIDQRFAESDYIRMAVSALQIDFPTADTATATFYRSLRSTTGDETRRMTLELTPSGDSWRIRRERFLD